MKHNYAFLQNIQYSRFSIQYVLLNDEVSKKNVHPVYVELHHLNATISDVTLVTVKIWHRWVLTHEETGITSGIPVLRGKKTER